MLYRPSVPQSLWFTENGKPELRHGFIVNQQAFMGFLREAQTAHKEYSWDHRVAWAAYNAYTHPNHRPAWIWRLLTGLLTVLLLASCAFAEPPNREAVVRRIVEIVMASPQGPFGTPTLARMQIRSAAGAWVDLSATTGLPITCLSGCGGLAAFLDNAAFVAGLTPVGITAGWFSNSPTACTSGNACAPSLTSDRKLFTQAFQGTSPWVVSLASTTITGTVSATQSGNWASRIVGNAGGLLDTTQNAAVPANALSVGCNFTTAPATLTTGNQGATQCNSKGELLTQLTDGATNVSAISATNALKTDLSSVAGTATSTAAAGVQLVGIEGRAGTSLETTAGVVDTNLKNVGNSAVVTAATGVQKVGIVGNTGATLDSASGAALPTNSQAIAGRDSTQTGGGTAIPVVCDKSAFINPTTATTTQIVALSGSTIIYICGYTLTNGTVAQSVILKFGTGAACATGTTSLTATYFLPVNGTFSYGGGFGTVARTTAGQALCATTSGASVSTGITVSYAQF